MRTYAPTTSILWPTVDRIVIFIRCRWNRAGPPWHVNDLTVVTHAPLAGSNALAYVRSDSVDVVAYRGSDNNIHEMSLAPPPQPDGYMEVLLEACSAAVSIPRAGYDQSPLSQGAIIIHRDQSGNTGWTPPFRVQLGDSGRIRWWCDSTTGNWADPGTWRIHVEAGGLTACLVSVAAGAVATVATGGKASPAAIAAGTLGCGKSITISSSAVNGWTAEQSRCTDRSNLIRARLTSDQVGITSGPRRLQIQCLGY